VIEDCAHALGASNAGRPAGSLGTAAYFSTDHTKIISTGAGGMVTTDDADLAARVSAIQRASPFLPSWRIRRLLAALASEIVLLSPELCLAGRYLQALFARMGLREGFFADELLTTLPATPAYPARLSNAQAVIGLRQLDTLDSNLAWRRHVVALFDDALETVGRGGSRQALLRYTFLVENREAWIRHLEQAVDPNVWFTSVVHGRDLNLNEVAYEWGSCPTAEQSALHCVNLPTHRRIRRPERLVDLVRSALHSADPAFRLMRT
jgi:dTDP-4-amino-4,6-dideoxygalactose transaminase